MIRWRTNLLTQAHNELKSAVATLDLLTNYLDNKISADNTSINNIITMHDKNGECRVPATTIRNTIQSIEESVNLLTLIDSTHYIVSNLASLEPLTYRINTSRLY